MKVVVAFPNSSCAATTTAGVMNAPVSASLGCPANDNCADGPGSTSTVAVPLIGTVVFTVAVTVLVPTSVELIVPSICPFVPVVPDG